jgi:hypothetical protein
MWWIPVSTVMGASQVPMIPCTRAFSAILWEKTSRQTAVLGGIHACSWHTSSLSCHHCSHCHLLPLEVARIYQVIREGQHPAATGVQDASGMKMMRMTMMMTKVSAVQSTGGAYGEA